MTQLTHARRSARVVRLYDAVRHSGGLRRIILRVALRLAVYRAAASWRALRGVA